jgi:hypothetical protein
MAVPFARVGSSDSGDADEEKKKMVSSSEHATGSADLKADQVGSKPNIDLGNSKANTNHSLPDLT